VRATIALLWKNYGPRHRAGDLANSAASFATANWLTAGAAAKRQGNGNGTPPRLRARAWKRYCVLNA
jgi:hypothetical protein